MAVVEFAQSQTDRRTKLGQVARTGGTLAGVLVLLAGCGSASGSSGASIKDAASKAPTIAAPSARSVQVDPSASLNVDTVCPPVTDGKKIISVSFELVNLSTSDMSVTGISALLPYKGLHQQGSTESGGSCLNPGSSSDVGFLAAGSRQLYTMTFGVPKACPQTQQIQATVKLKVNGAPLSTTVPVLNDLKSVRFDNC